MDGRRLATVALACLLAALTGAPAAAAAGDPDGRLFTNDARVARVDIQLPDAALDALRQDPDTYVTGTVAIAAAGEPSSGPVKADVRLKGGKLGSFRTLDGKAAFKIKVNKANRPFGLKKLTLNNMVEDRSMLHEALSYSVYRAMGLAAPRTGYAVVTLNGADYGLHLNVETLDDLSLPDTKHLYEGEYGTDVTPGGEGAFEVDEGDETDRSDLTALIGAAAGGGDFTDAMAPVADLGQMTRMWAVEQYAGHWDGYAGPSLYPTLAPNNYYLRSDLAGRFTMVPWGTDQDWEQPVEFGSGTGLLFRRCQADARCAALYRQAVIEVRGVAAGLGLDAQVAAMQAALVPFQQADTRREQSMVAIAEGASAMRAFIAARPGDVDAWLAPPVPSGSGPAPSGGAASAPSRPRARIAAIGRSRLSGTYVVTRVRVTGGGRVSQRVVRGRHSLCTARTTARRAGTVTLRCRLSRADRRRAARTRLAVRVRTRFQPATGSAQSSTRGAVL